MKKQKPLGMRIGESVFEAGYLLFAIIAGLIFLQRGNSLCAAMTLLLGCGDAFHLIPRIMINIKGDGDNDAFWLGLGNMISSITMTVFYVLMVPVMWQLHSGILMPEYLRLLPYLAGLRVLLCLLPQNKWFSRDNNSWGIYRNIPFVIMGLITVIYLINPLQEYLLAGLVTVSFVCYMLVVLYAHQKPMIGMMMIPKTICYIWMIANLLSR